MFGDEAPNDQSRDATGADLQNFDLLLLASIRKQITETHAVLIPVCLVLCSPDE